MTSSSAPGFAGLWAALEPVGRSSSGGYRRFAWSATDRVLREWFADECAKRGLDYVEDRAGNQWAWWGDPDAAPGQGVVTGSHLDSVPDGGPFDGPLGVISALAAVDALRRVGFQPAKPIGVVCFADEEGARFGVACSGSRLVAGSLSPERALALRDVDGLSMAEALTAAGRDLTGFGPDPAAVQRVGHFVELHVEQGRALDHIGASVAVGTDIWPHGRWRIDFPGEANHAGTTALRDRRDAMLGYADTVLAARATAQEHDCLATIGRVSVRPGAVNAIPSSVTGWLDVRGSDPTAVRRTVLDITAHAGSFGATVVEESWTDDTRFDTSLVRRMQRALGNVPLLSTGAGHDAGVLAAAGVSSAMLFVRNPSGVSHSPAERAELADCLAGVEALTTVLADLAGPPG
ncbi:allantoate amidohydrolase [uncultured Friedmanniella sp.]|uniref:allantoate amidohydrolase n=1 Tax=uncultured Friedmanniella sp. TaxID=335381 RepID=UPI0035C99ADE